jgi:hypothetical protein
MRTLVELAQKHGCFLGEQAFTSLCDNTVYEALILRLKRGLWALYMVDGILVLEGAASPGDGAAHVSYFPHRMTVGKVSDEMPDPVQFLLEVKELDSFPPGHGSTPVKPPSFIMYPGAQT